MKIAQDVQEALSCGKPVVALESTIISHGKYMGSARHDDKLVSFFRLMQIVHLLAIININLVMDVDNLIMQWISPVFISYSSF